MLLWEEDTPSTPKPVNENVEPIASLGSPAEFNEDQRFSLTAETLTDIFISQIQYKNPREKKRFN
jgi:hypothetical protein